MSIPLSALGLAVIATLSALHQPHGSLSDQSTSGVSAVVILDSSITTTMGTVPFVWDGNGSVRDGFPTGKRPPDKPSDVFMLPLLDGLFPVLTELDRIQLWSVSRVTRKGSSVSGNRRDLLPIAREILNLSDRDRFGPAPVWDAVVEAADDLRGEPGRRMVLVVSSGMTSTTLSGPFSLKMRCAGRTALY